MAEESLSLLSTTTGPITEELSETLRGLLTNDDFGELSEEQVTPAAVSHLSDERYLESFVGGEVSKKEYFLFHNLPWPPSAKTGLLSLSQGKFLSEQRMKDLNFVKSGGDTPGDGNYKRTEMEDCKLRIRHVHQDWNIDVGI